MFKIQSNSSSDLSLKSSMIIALATLKSLEFTKTKDNIKNNIKLLKFSGKPDSGGVRGNGQDNCNETAGNKIRDSRTHPEARG